MSPDDLRIVQWSWSQLRLLRAPLLDALTDRYTVIDADVLPAVRARWLLDAVEELVGLLASPSHLAERARALGATWPDPCTAPTFGVDGRAWLAAARTCLPTWRVETEDAWRQAWLLLSDVLAAEALSPFTDHPSSPSAATDGRSSRKDNAHG